MTDNKDFSDALALARRVQLAAEAPAMLAALCDMLGAAEAEALDDKSNVWRSAMIEAAAIIARIDGAAPAPTAPAPVAADKVGPMVQALELAEGFIAGFEDDETQEGVDWLLATIRAAIPATPTAQPAGPIGEAGGDEPQKPVCRSCGGDSVVIDGAARWNMAGQDWGLSGTYDDSAYCDDCEGETKLNWVAVAPDELAAANLSGPALIAAAREAEALAGEA